VSDSAMPPPFSIAGLGLQSIGRLGLQGQGRRGKRINGRRPTGALN
jgi:hypothetical protein